MSKNKSENLAQILGVSFGLLHQSPRLDENYRIKNIEWWKKIKMKMIQQGNNDENALKKAVSTRKIGPWAMVSLAVSLQRKQTCWVNKFQLGN